MASVAHARRQVKIACFVYSQPKVILTKSREFRIHPIDSSCRKAATSLFIPVMPEKVLQGDPSLQLEFDYDPI